MGKVTVACVPREVFSQTRRSLESLVERTGLEHELIYVDGGSPPEVRRYLEGAAREHGFRLIRTDHYLSPNQARNMALEHVDTPYVAFVDNDVLVDRGWLEALVACAEETGAWAVSPLICEHLPELSRIHIAGGQCQVRTDGDGRRYIHERHDHGHQPLDELTEPLTRKATELFEFHTVLLSTQALADAGGCDEGLLCHSEHVDVSLSILEHGGSILLEPSSRVTYAPPRRLSSSEREFFELRWSEAWCRASFERLIDKWRLAPDHSELERAWSWLREHRRYGSRLLPPLRRALGWRLSQLAEKLLFEPLEVRWNAHRFPAHYFGAHRLPTTRAIVDYGESAS